VKAEAKKKERTFRENPFDSMLRTHKLHGKEKDAYAFWINYSYRIKFIFLDEENVLLLDIGTHDVYF
jgi:plasmid maintenance system killer protein